MARKSSDQKRKERLHAKFITPDSIWNFYNDDRLLFDVLLKLCHMAVFYDETDTALMLKKGQLVTSDRELSTYFRKHHNASPETIARKLKKIAKLGFIALERVKYVGTKITVRHIAGTRNESENEAVNEAVNSKKRGTKTLSNQETNLIVEAVNSKKRGSKCQSLKTNLDLELELNIKPNTYLNSLTVCETSPQEEGKVSFGENIFPLDRDRVAQAEEVLRTYQEHFPAPSEATRSKFIAKFLQEKFSTQKLIEHVRALAADRTYGDTYSPMRLFFFDSNTKGIRDMLIKRAGDGFNWSQDVRWTIDSLAMDESIRKHFALDSEGLKSAVLQIAREMEIKMAARY